MKSSPAWRQQPGLLECRKTAREILGKETFFQQCLKQDHLLRFWLKLSLGFSRRVSLREHVLRHLPWSMDPVYMCRISAAPLSGEQPWSFWLSLCWWQGSGHVALPQSCVTSVIHLQATMEPLTMTVWPTLEMEKKIIGKWCFWGW